MPRAAIDWAHTHHRALITSGLCATTLVALAVPDLSAHATFGGSS